MTHLAKLAHRSAQLRQAAIKEAGLVGAIGSAAKSLGGYAIENPGKALFGSLAVAGGVSGAKGKYKQYKAGFDPAVQQAMLGNPPVGH